MKRPVIIIGAGLAGLAAASKLEEIEIFEAAQEAGGVARTYHKDGFSYDLGPHVLYFRKPEIERWTKRILGGQWTYQQRKARIAIHGELVDYPIQEGFLAFPALRKRFLKDLLNASREKTTKFTRMANNLHGKALAEEFFIPYNTKLWRYPLDDMEKSWAERFIPCFPKQDLEHVACGRVIARGANAGFFYPKGGGIGILARILAQALGEKLRLSNEAVRINTKERWVESEDGKRHSYSKLISTIPLPELVKLCVDLPAKAHNLAAFLKSVGMVFVHLSLANPLRDDSHWVYYPDPAVVFHRISIPENYNKGMTPQGKGSLVAETAFLSDEKPDIQGLVQRTKEGVVRLGMIRGADEIIADEVQVRRHAYVFPTAKGEAARVQLRSILKQKGVVLAGRYAIWEYGNMESALAQGFEAAQKVESEL